MISIEYCAEGEPVSDFNYKDFVKKVFTGEIDAYYKVSTSIACSVIRLAIARKDWILTHKDIEFIFNGKTITFNEFGRAKDWPRGFCDADIDVAEELLRIQYKEHKREKDK